MEDLFLHDPNCAGAKGLVYIGDKVLVYRRDDGISIHPGELDLPGGASKDGETPFETFKRKLNEEFGLAIEPEHITYARKYSNSVEPTKSGFFIVAKLPDDIKDKITFGSDGTEYMLATIEDYLDRSDAWPEFQKRSGDYIKSL